MPAIIVDIDLAGANLGVVGVHKDGSVGFPNPGCDGSCQDSVQEWFVGCLQLQLVRDTWEEDNVGDNVTP